MDTEIAYRFSKKLVNCFYFNHSILRHLEFEDYVQDCMVAWLENKNMRFSCIETFRRHAPLSRSYMGKLPIPTFFPIENQQNLQNDCLEQIWFHLDLLDIRKAINKLPKRMSYVLFKYVFEHLTLKQIGDQLGVTENRASQIQKDGIKLLRKRLK